MIEYFINEVMRMKKELPILVKPPIIAYQYHAYSLGALFQNATFIDYFMCNYINIFYNKRLCNKANFTSEDDKYFDEMPSFTRNTISFQNNFLFDYSCDSFTKMVMFMIENEYYINGFINEYYVPDRTSYRSCYFRHDFLIYGYDYEQKVFNSIGYNSNWDYKEHYIPFEDFYYGIKSVKGTNWIHFFKNIKEYKYSFDITNFKKQLYNYLNSVNTNNNLENDCFYGINVYHAFAIDIEANPKYIDLRYVRLLLEHKRCMYLRIQYLITNGYLEDDNYLSAYSEIVRIFEIIFNITMKNNKSNKCTDRILNYLQSSIEKETKILTRVLYAV